MSDRVRLAVIIASTRHGRFGPVVADWFVRQASRRRDLAVDIIDLADTRLPDTLTEPDQPVPDAVGKLAPRLAMADAFVVVTPEYNRSFPAPLKTAIDWFYEQWRAKPVAFVSYGRESGGLYAVGQLRQVFTELHAMTIRETVSLPCYWDLFAADGSWPRHTAECNTTVRTLLDQLTWWAYALRDGRATRAYPT
jgi:NAD(P)H-dependent FMN reductase